MKHVCVVSFILVTGLSACVEGLDGSQTAAACKAYVASANACWDKAGEASEITDDACNDVDAEIHYVGSDTTMAEIFQCYADAYTDHLDDGLCDSAADASAIDVSKCSS